MFWKSRTAARARSATRKNRKLRLETVEQRQMLSGGPISHVLYGPICLGLHEPVDPGLFGPINPSQHSHVTWPVAMRQPSGICRPVWKQPLSEAHGLNHRDRPVLASPSRDRERMSESVAIDETIASGGSDLFVRETASINAEVEAGGVIQVTVDTTEDVYVRSNGGRLIAEEDVQVVAEARDAGDLRIDVNESETVVAQNGRALNIENVAQSVDVDAHFVGETASLRISASETAAAYCSMNRCDTRSGRIHREPWISNHTEVCCSTSLARPHQPYGDSIMFRNSHKAVSAKNASRKSRKLAMETIEEREMLSAASPMILACPPVSTSMVIASQSSEVSADFTGSGDLTVNESESQMLFSQNQLGRSTQVASQGQCLGLQFAGTGDLTVNEGESQMLFSQNQLGRSTQVASQGQCLGLEFAGTGDLTVNEGESQTVFSQNQFGRSTQVASQGQGLGLEFAGTGDLAVNEGESQTVFSQSQPGRSAQVASQFSAVDAYFAGLGSASMSAQNSETAFLQVG